MTEKELIEYSSDNGGFFVLALDYNAKQLKQLADEFKKKQPNHNEIVWLKGTESKSLFQSIQNTPKVEIINNQPRTVHSGLKITQDKPIILVIEDFDKLQTANDQYNISKILSKEESFPFNIYPNSIVIISFKKGEKLDIKQGFADWYVIDE
jgi:hypothetical protein